MPASMEIGSKTYFCPTRSVAVSQARTLLMSTREAKRGDRQPRSIENRRHPSASRLVVESYGQQRHGLHNAETDREAPA
jgi:hypothetical protein